MTRILLAGFDDSDLNEMDSALGLGNLYRPGALRLLAHTDGNSLYCRALLQEFGVPALNAIQDSGCPPRDLRQ